MEPRCLLAPTSASTSAAQAEEVLRRVQKRNPQLAFALRTPLFLSHWFTMIGTSSTHLLRIQEDSHEAHPGQTCRSKESLERTWHHRRRCHGPARLPAKVFGQGKG